jgi:nucleotide-binding universal stress UspA family protein
MKILIAYDGSPDAKAAVALAGHLFDGSTAVVLTVWEGFTEVIGRAGAGLPPSLDFDEIDTECEQWARDRAAEGAGHARAAGLQAEAHVVRREGSSADAILDEARAMDTELVVVGTRGFSPVKSMLLGSVSCAVLQHATTPVLLAPAADRRAKRLPIDEPFLSARL